ncbi:MAG: 50S ribosomal protein L13 [Candidatus Daviesbacteria bacterium]|nr:50S ribosomal protein L13 [Candidatus Daviesbacteria bacterium]
MSTNALKASDIKRDWHLIDAKGKILGRLATEIATILMGKNKPNYVPYLDSGDYVVVTNAKLVKVTGQKETQKVYTRHSGYPGGLRQETLAKLRARKPEEIIKHAVKGMIPKTKLGADMIAKLHIYASVTHPYAKNFTKIEESENAK